MDVSRQAKEGKTIRSHLEDVLTQIQDWMQTKALILGNNATKIIPKGLFMKGCPSITSMLWPAQCVRKHWRLNAIYLKIL